jgi:transglutaminase-like putative cysteine protease
MVSTRLAIRHSTVYRYLRPVVFNRHRLVVRPREGHDLRIEELRLDIFPANTVTWVRDVFGNSVAWVDFTEPATELRIRSEVTVVRGDPFPARLLHQPVLVPYPVVYDPLEQPVTAAYLHPSFPEDVETLQRWLRRYLVLDKSDAEGTALTLCGLIHSHVAYRRRTEKGVQTPAATLGSGSGSCRDAATLMLECARVLGMAARFASGYLHGRASLAGRASTHAWAEVYLPNLGWRGFDPSIGQPTATNHIVSGVSNHPRGVMPVSGSYSGARSDFVEMVVEVGTEELVDPERGCAQAHSKSSADVGRQASGQP